MRGRRDTGAAGRRGRRGPGGETAAARPGVRRGAARPGAGAARRARPASPPPAATAPPAAAPAAPVRPGPDPGELVELRRKYQDLVGKYAGLVKRSGASTVARSDLSTMALAALRSSPSARALLRDGHVAIRNRAWTALERAKTPWIVRGAGGAPPHDSAEALAGDVAAGLEDGRLAVRTVRCEHEGAWFDVRVERLARPVGAPLVAVQIDDVTAAVRAEDELARAHARLEEQDRLRAVGELASGVAHDVNNTLHAIAMHLALLRRTPEVMAHRAVAIEALTRIVADAGERVARLQDFARQRGDAAPSSFDPAAVVREAVEMVGAELLGGEQGRPQVKVALDLPPVRRAVGFDAELRQVFVNLLLNAREAMPGGGTVRIGARDAGDWVVLVVSDTGAGIPSEALPRVFDPFFTTRPGRGTGLGLSIARTVMRRIGGSISAHNAPDGGAVFTLQFPAAPPEEAAPPRAPDAPAAEASARARVLVVDDDADNLEVTRLALEELGNEVATAASGEEALAAAARAPAPEVVLCDVGMPGMSGWDVARRLRELAPAAAIYMVTGWAQELAPDDPRRALADGVLGKPLDLARMAQVVAAAARRGAPAPSAAGPP